MMNSRWGQPRDFAILNQESTALTKTVGVSETYGHVGREFKLRTFSAGSILTLRNKIEPLASTTSLPRTPRKMQSTRPTPSITAPGKLALTTEDTEKAEGIKQMWEKLVPNHCQDSKGKIGVRPAICDFGGGLM